MGTASILLLGAGFDKFTLSEVTLLPEFRNEPFTDFSVEANQQRLPRRAARRSKSDSRSRGATSSAARPSRPTKHFESVNPSDFQQVIGRFPEGTIADAGRAVDVATKAFASWSRMPAAERAALVLRIGAILRRRKHEFSAMMVLEESKSWPEADGDTAEAIDFCEFYAREMERLAGPQPADAVPRRAQRAAAHPPRRLRRHPALELPARDPLRHDDGGARRRQHGRAQALLRRRRHRHDVPGGLRGGGRAATASSTS